MRVQVRAVILERGRLLVVSQRRAGAHSHYALPGGRVGRGESITDALVREVREEAGFDVIPQRLLYVAEVTPKHGVQDLNLIFLGEPAVRGDLGGTDLTDLVLPDHAPAQLVDLGEPVEAVVLPPIVGEVVNDLSSAWAETPRWLGNLWDASLKHRSCAHVGTAR